VNNIFPLTLVVTDDGGVQLDAAAMSLLTGCPADEIGRLSTQGDKWMRRGRQRSNEAQAHTNSTAMLDGLRYWAHKDHGADLVVTYVREDGSPASADHVRLER
jgi:hypothetical protein